MNRKVGINMLSFSFADRVQNLNPSAIREILKYSADPEVVGLCLLYTSPILQVPSFQRKLNLRQPPGQQACAPSGTFRTAFRCV